MKIIGENELYLHWKDLQAYGFSEISLKMGTIRFRKGESASYENLPDPDNGQKNLIKYDSIPRKEEVLPPKDQLIASYKSDQLAALVVEDPMARSYYLNKGLEAQRAQNYTEQAAWLMVCAPMNRSQARNMGYNSVDDFYSDVMLYTSKREILLILNLGSFKRKIKPFKQLAKAEPEIFDADSPDYFLKREFISAKYEEALDSLVSGKLGKRNAAKLRPRDDERGKMQTEEMRSEILRLKKQAAPKLSDEQVFQFYMLAAKKKYEEYNRTDGLTGWDEKCYITLQTCKNFIKESRSLWISDRDGIKEYNNNFKRIVDRRRESRANAKWIIDGTPLHMYFMKDGKPYQRMNLFLVLDGHSYCILGYSLSFNENGDQVIEALRMACQNTGYMPDEIQSDNGRAINNWHVKHALNSITPRWIPAEVGNARAKKIESFFGHFDDRVLKFIPGYTGNPFAKMSTTRPNLDHVNDMIKQGLIPEFRESWDLIENGLNQWNSQLFDKAYPMEKYKKSVKNTLEYQRKFTHELDVDAFWYMPGEMKQFDDLSSSKRKKMSVFVPQEYQYTNRGIVVEHKDMMGDSQRYIFDVPDAAFSLDNIGKSFRIKIEPKNFNKAYIYDGNKPVCDLKGNPLLVEKKHLFASAKVDMMEGENAMLHKRLQIDKDQKSLAEARMNNYMRVNKEAGLIESAIKSQAIYGGKDEINDGKEELITGLSRVSLNAKKKKRSSADEAESA